MALRSPSRRALFALVTSGSLERAVRRVPPVRARAERAARRYVAGTTRDEAFEVVRRLDAEGMTASVDLFGEMVTDPAEAERAAAEYVELAKLTADLPEGTWLALDLSHLGLDVSADFCRRQLARVVEALPIGRWIQVGAEDSGRTDAALDVVTALAGESAALTMTVQANLRRSPADARRLADAEVPIRLVKGAYAEPPAVALPWGEPSDVAFLRLATQLADAGAAFSIATHDAVLREAVLARREVPVEMLLGVRPDHARALVARGTAVRVYVPYGPGWFRYWLRRVAESRGTS
jgi:proline dehydrogenase